MKYQCISCIFICWIACVSSQIIFGDTIEISSTTLAPVSKEMPKVQEESDFDPFCKTNGDGPVKNAPCVFPFTVNGRKYHGCTIDYDAKNRYWCSTQVDEDGQHVPSMGKWGYCKSNCRKQGEVNELFWLFCCKVE